eukprot:6197141-Pleurochrysis_carterae.AAC.1
MASSIACWLASARALNQDDEMLIDMRAQARIALAPDEGGGRATAQRTAPSPFGIVINATATCIGEFAKLIALPPA